MRLQDMQHIIDALVAAHLGDTFPSAQIALYRGGKLALHKAYGWLDPETRLVPIHPDIRYDLASVSKLFVVAAFMTLVEQGSVRLDQPVSEVLPAFSGRRVIEPYPHPLKPGEFVEVVPRAPDRFADASQVTFRHLLSHNSGLPAWLPLWRMNVSIAERRATALNASFAYPIGTRVVYSDIGLMLVGFAIEALTHLSLREVVRQRVTAPLNLTSIGYGPIHKDSAAPTEVYAHQPQRMQGEVHDENAWSLGGVSGHAGLFGAARDVAAFGESLRTATLLSRETLREMQRLQAYDGAVRRGIGFVLWTPSADAAINPLSPLAFGHTGFTGTSLWVDPLRELSVAFLANHVYYGRNALEKMQVFRVALNRVLSEMILIG
jgi:CubicO group peptidase (beta-lactamase class C family)